MPRRKRSTGKATWPGRKQVWRRYDAAGIMAGDVITTEDDVQEGEPLLQPVMRNGRRIGPAPTLAEIRARAADNLRRLPEPLRQRAEEATYPVRVADALQRLGAEVDRRLAEQERVRP